MHTTMIEPTRIDLCNMLPRTLDCRAPFMLRRNKAARQLVGAAQSKDLIASLRKYEQQEDGVVNWEALHTALQLSCQTY